jgi:hypothetical protein
MDYTDQKAVEIEWDLVEEAAFLSYAGDYWGNHGFAHKTLKGPEQYLYRFGGIRK